MLMRSAPHAQKLAGNATQVQGQPADRQFDRQVSATQQLIQAEERRLQSQFAQIEKLRNAAIDKQDQKELERLQRVEQQVVADYQKRVEQVLLGAQAQIQATTIHVQSPEAQQAAPAQQPTSAQQPNGSSRTQTRATQSGQTRTQSSGAAKSQAPQQQSRQPSRSAQKSSNSRSAWSWRR